MFYLLLLQIVNEIDMNHYGDFIAYLCKIIIWAFCLFVQAPILLRISFSNAVALAQLWVAPSPNW